jgi:hypothetical protein
MDSTNSNRWWRESERETFEHFKTALLSTKIVSFGKGCFCHDSFLSAIEQLNSCATLFFLFSQGTYLLLEKCKTVCYRNLFKRVHKILDKHQISLHYVAKAFKWLGLPIDLDEVECILANLIYRGYVRGYLSHSKRVLVLSKRDPFPTDAVIAK